MKATAALGTLLLLAACSQGPPRSAADAEPVALVTLAPATEAALPEAITLYGAAEDSVAAKQVLAAPMEAVVMAFDAPEGTAVTRSRIIARLAPSPASWLDLAKTAAEAQAANAAYARAQRLRADGLVGDAEVEAARVAARSASAAQASLGDRTKALALRSPIAGVVETLSASPGDQVAAGAVIATIASGSRRAKFGADPAILRRIPPGASIRVRSTSGKAFTTTVLSASPAVDPQTRLAALFAALPSDLHIGSGEALVGEVRLAPTAPTPVIPYAALLDEGGQPYVFVVAGGIAHRRDVATGASEGNRIAILKGVKRGEQVVIAGGTALEDGMKVRTR